MRCLEALREAFVSVALGVNEELFKVPPDVGALDWLPNDELGIAHQTVAVVRRQRQVRLEPSEYFVFSLTVGSNLIKHDALWLEPVARPDVFQGIHNFLAIRILLMPKLVCGEGENDQLIAVLLAEIIHLREVTDGRAS